MKYSEYNGELLTVTQLFELPECSVSYSTVQRRIASGMPAAQAIQSEKSIRISDNLKSERARIKAIMAVPVKPTSSYLYYFDNFRNMDYYSSKEVVQ